MGSYKLEPHHYSTVRDSNIFGTVTDRAFLSLSLSVCLSGALFVLKTCTQINLCRSIAVTGINKNISRLSSQSFTESGFSPLVSLLTCCFVAISVENKGHYSQNQQVHTDSVIIYAVIRLAAKLSQTRKTRKYRK